MDRARRSGSTPATRRLPARPALLTALMGAGCAGPAPEGSHVTAIVFPASAVGAEAELLRRQVDRFTAAHPDIRVRLEAMPDAADERHLLYVQRLNAGAAEPDLLQLDVIWTPEFAASGWILPLDRFGPAVSDFHPASLAPARWNGSLWALPWFVDVAMLYYRTDLVAGPPESLEALEAAALGAMGERGVPYGLVWQGARYEGLVTVFLEYLGAFGGHILDPQGRVAVDSEAAVAALRHMRGAIHERAVVPEAALTWHEEEARFAFQNGRAVFMRNWPYACALLARDDSAVAGRFAVAPMPGTARGRPTASLGGQQLAVNRRSRHPEAAYRLAAFLTRPEQMLERARVLGQWPPRLALYDDPRLAAALPVPPRDARAVIERAEPRPVTPRWSELSAALQIELHRALTEQVEPEDALAAAASRMRAVLAVSP